MKKLPIILALLLALTLLGGCGQDAPPSDSDSSPQPQPAEPSAEQSSPPESPTDGDEPLGDRFYRAFTAGEYQTAFDLCAPAVQSVFQNADGMMVTLFQLSSQYGALTGYEEGRVSESQAGTVYSFPTNFEKGRLLATVTVQGDLVAGVYFTAWLGEAEAYLEAFFAEDYETVFEGSEEELRGFYGSAEGVGALAAQLAVQTGGYLSHQSPSGIIQADSVVYTFPVAFENGEFSASVAVRDGLVGGFGVQPVLSNENNANALALREGPVPSDDLPQGVAELDLTINATGRHPLHGKLTFPAERRGPIPAVVLVHGSGAHDMDETIAGNKPFKDIAYALSRQGIAVLRYNKVTYAYPEDFAVDIHIDEETVNDAVAARTALLLQSSVQISEIYVAGHSLGGMMAPRIAAMGEYDGMILLAGTTRSLVEVGYDQANYLLALTMSGEQMAQVKTEYDQLLAEAREILKKPLEELRGLTVMNGFSAYYIHSMDNPPPAQYIRELDLPMLILQGGKDFQIYPDRDFALYAEVTRGLGDVTMKEYPGLNHMFMPSFMEKPDTTEYNAPANVAKEVTDDIAAWVLERQR